MPPAKILIVDDEVIVTESTRGLLRQFGYAVTGTATSADTALAAIAHERPDLVLMDINLGDDPDGIAAADTIRTRHGLPVVFITAYADDDTLARAKITHPFGYVTKPFESRDLRVAIEIALHNHVLEQRLQASELKFHTLVEEAGDGFEFLDETGQYLEVNATSCRQLGYKRAELLRLNVTDVDPLLSREKFTAQFRALVGQPPVTFESVHRGKNGSTFPVEVTVSIVETGGARRALALVRDISRRKRMEQVLAEQAETYRALLSTTLDGVLETDEHEHIVDANQAYCRLLGYTRAELTSMRIQELEANERPDEVEQHTRRLIREGGGRFETRHRAKDGRLIDLAVNVTHIPSRGRFVAFFDDITARKEAEERIIALVEMVNAAPLSITVHDFAGRFLYANPPTFALHQYSESEFMALTLRTIDVPASAALIQARVEQIAQTGQASFEVGHFRKDGSVVPLELMVKTVSWRGQPALLSIGRDITQRQAAEAALRESELRYRILADSGQALIWTSGLDKRCDYFNQPWLAFTGRTLAQELGDGWAEGVHPDDLQRCVEIYVGGFDRRERFSMDYRLRHHSGEFRWIQDDGTPRYDSRGNFQGYIGHCLDITARKRAEDEVRKQGARLQHALRAANAGVWEWELATNRNYWSDELWALYGLDGLTWPASFESWRESVHAEDRAAMVRAVQGAAAEGGDISIEYRVNLPSGTLRWLMSQGQPQKDATGRVVAYRGAVIDITQRKQAEAVLEASQRENQAVLDSITDAFISLTDDMVVRYFNPAAERLLHRKSTDVLGRNLFAAFPEAKGSVFEEKYAEAIRTKSALAFEVQFTVAPYQNWYDVRVYPNRGGITIYFQVITARKQAEERLLQSEADLNRAQAIAHLGNWSWDIRNDVVEWSAEMFRIYGANPETFDRTVNGVAKLIHPEDLPRQIRAIETLLQGGSFEPFEYRVLRPENEIRVVQVFKADVERNASGQPIRMFGAAQDITERKEAEAALRKHAEELQAQNRELERFNRASVGRELRMIALKQEVNDLCQQAGRPPRYPTQPAAESDKPAHLPSPPKP